MEAPKPLIIAIMLLAVLLLLLPGTLGKVLVGIAIVAVVTVALLKSRRKRMVSDVEKYHAGNGWMIKPVDKQNVEVFYNKKTTGLLTLHDINVGLDRLDLDAPDYLEQSRLLHTALEVINGYDTCSKCKRD